MGHICDWSF